MGAGAAVAMMGTSTGSLATNGVATAGVMGERISMSRGVAGGSVGVIGRQSAISLAQSASATLTVATG